MSEQDFNELAVKVLVRNGLPVDAAHIKAFTLGYVTLLKAAQQQADAS